ncbi:50S ribosomal protein L24 [Akkermansiaceae bacterium]|nr:50S ribosomal protein L24 [Akkermansiaceae bacterium]
MSKKTHVRIGDNVKVIAGSAKGQEGKVLSINAAKQQVLVEGAKQMTKAVRPTEQAEGGLLKVDKPIHISNVKKQD